MSHPIIIQGGMGVAVSGWRLARTVSQLGQLGVVSGTILAVVLSRSLQQGDIDGHLRRALGQFPVPAMTARILDRYFIPGGKPAGKPYLAVPMPSVTPSQALTELTVVANFVEVFLAREGHDGVIGINLLEKIAFPTMASLYGAMLAGVNYVLMGAGIPRAIPGVLDRFARGEAAELDLPVEDAEPGATARVRFDPAEFFAASFSAQPASAASPAPPTTPPALDRPYFLAIVSSAPLATTLARKANGRVDGFVVEGEPAGGHNAPPRGALQLSDDGEPVYGPRDVPDLAKIRELGVPFWLAGACARTGRLADAIAQGATGVQVGTAFAFCRESGLSADIKRRACALSREGRAGVFTDPRASPTGFPFKVLQLGDTLSDAAPYAARKRICDLGYMRQTWRRPDGSLGYRCSAEPEADFVRKGGAACESAGRKCLCNALLSAVGLGQRLSGKTASASGDPLAEELPLVTAGADVAGIARYLQPGADSYGAADVVRMLLEPVGGSGRFDESAGGNGESIIDAPVAHMTPA
ncbi:2-nitropropane dioxygenase [Opitutaceae bacterium TAV5]|nr:2-nitropropane dioxygenase [Opitutaceae bacterium TAV5]